MTTEMVMWLTVEVILFILYLIVYGYIVYRRVRSKGDDVPHYLTLTDGMILLAVTGILADLRPFGPLATGIAITGIVGIGVLQWTNRLARWLARRSPQYMKDDLTA